MIFYFDDKEREIKVISVVQVYELIQKVGQNRYNTMSKSQRVDAITGRKGTPTLIYDGVKDRNVGALASFLCELRGYDPTALEPGNVPCEDGTCPNGECGQFLWRQFVPEAVKIINFMCT